MPLAAKLEDGVCGFCPSVQNINRHDDSECKKVVQMFKKIAKDYDKKLLKYSVKTTKKKRKQKIREKIEKTLRRPSIAPSLNIRQLIRGEHCKYDYDAPCQSQPSKTEAKRSKWLDSLSWSDVNIGPCTAPCSHRPPSKCHILMPRPKYRVIHGSTASSESLLRVTSPKMSGEVVRPRLASLTPSENVVPLPPKNVLCLKKPRSGLIINVNSSSEVHQVNKLMNQYYKSVGPPRTKTKSCKSCCHPGHQRRRTLHRRRKHRHHVTRICKCTAKRKKKGKRKGRYDDDPHYTSLGVAQDKPFHDRSTQKHLRGDDSICGIDEPPPPEHIRIPQNVQHGTLQAYSMTVLQCPRDKSKDIPFGLLSGSYNIFDNKYSAKSKGKQSLTTSIMAYCLAFHYHPKQWTMKLIDNILDSGDQWYNQLNEAMHEHSTYPGMCEVVPFGKKQNLVLNKKRMQVLLSEPDVIGYSRSLDPTIYNLCKGLKAFFALSHAGILLTSTLKLVIWKTKVCYYIFDPAGRDIKAYANYVKSPAALMSVCDLDSVTEIVLTRSTPENQKYVLSTIKVLKMIDERCPEEIDSEQDMTAAEKAMAEYRILSENCAIVTATLNLGDRCFENAKNLQALTVAVIALTYAKISPPNTWRRKTLDKIMRFGNQLFLNCSQPEVLIDLTIDNIPKDFELGPYQCEIIIFRERVKGMMFTTKQGLLNLDAGLEEFFNKEYNSGILQFNNYSFAIWRQKGMFYYFDPYPRSPEGLKTTKGKACVVMGLNVDTLADLFKKNWDYLPPTTLFHIHAFKVLKVRKEEYKGAIVCTLSDIELPGPRKDIVRTILQPSKPDPDAKGDSTAGRPTPANFGEVIEVKIDEEHLGDLISLVESIHEDLVPPIPCEYKVDAMPIIQEKRPNLDSPTVSVTQIIPPWPAPRDKTGEPPEPDPDPEPEPVEVIEQPGEGGPEEGGPEEEEEEVGEEESDIESIEKVEEEQEVEVGPPPPPPTPPEPVPEPVAPIELRDDDAQTIQHTIKRKILLAADAYKRYRLRNMKKLLNPPLVETEAIVTQSQEIMKPSNFTQLPDGTQIINGTQIIEDKMREILPYVAIVSIVTSYKYTIGTWSSVIVDFILQTALKLHDKKLTKFRDAPVHIIPRLAIGRQAFKININVVGDGATWQLENILSHCFFKSYDRGMITTANYSCAIFKKNGLYYLFDGIPCNPMGLRARPKEKGQPALLRFRDLHALVNRILFNKNGDAENQHFILSCVLVRRLLKEPRTRLLELGSESSSGGSSEGSQKRRKKPSRQGQTKLASPVPSKNIEDDEIQSAKGQIGYQWINGAYRIEGTTSLSNRCKSSTGIKECHFVCLYAMLMLALHPVRTWDSKRIDYAIERGLEIYEHAVDRHICEKRVLKRLQVDNHFFDINVTKVLIINEESIKTLKQYLNTILDKLRFVIVCYPECCLIIHQNGGYYHLFDPYPPPSVINKNKSDDDRKDGTKGKTKSSDVATWILFRTIAELAAWLKQISPKNKNKPIFYTYEVTSVRKCPRKLSFNYKLNPVFKAEVGPKGPYHRVSTKAVNEKISWLSHKKVPWSPANPINDMGAERKQPQTMWKEWDIEFPHDLFSLWGELGPLSEKFAEGNRGKQILAMDTVAIAMVYYCDLSEWNADILNSIVRYGDKYHTASVAKLKQPNYELALTDLNSKFEMYPHSFKASFDHIIFGKVFNIHREQFNLSNALAYFFESNKNGILMCNGRNIAFGKVENSYFMFDAQSVGTPLFSPGECHAYILKCQSLNRLTYCLVVTLGIQRHGVRFDIYSVSISLSDFPKKNL